MLSDEGQMRAAHLMYGASERIERACSNHQQAIDSAITRLDEAFRLFHDSVERLVMDMPQLD